LLSVECHFKIYTLKSYIEKKKINQFYGIWRPI
jgi:hypothetical protein